MTIYDEVHNEVRFRHQSEFTSIPNSIQASEDLVDGTFCYFDLIGGLSIADQNTRQTHLVWKSGKHRLTATEISSYAGTIQTGEPCLTVTGGTGQVRIPFGADVLQGQDLTTDAAGLAVAWDADSGDAGAYLIGKAVEDVIADVNGDRFGEAMITLPAQHSPLTTA